MSNINNLLKALPSMEHSFSIDTEGRLTKMKYEGNFGCKIPNGKTQVAIAKHKAMLNGGFDDGLDIATKNFNHQISYLRYTLTEFPKWWKEADMGYELYDVNVVEEVYYKVLDFEKSWFESIWGKAEAEDASQE